MGKKDNKLKKQPYFPSMPPIDGLKLACVNAQISKDNKPDLMIAEASAGSIVCGLFTKSQTCSAAVKWSRNNLEKVPNSDLPLGLVVNSGNANVFTGQTGAEVVRKTAKALAIALNSIPKNIFVASTGVIGELLNVEKLTSKITPMVRDLSKSSYKAAAEAIMTTDTYPKGVSKELNIDGVNVKINGIAKGSGMIAPNMATMLVFIFSDISISQKVLQEIVSSENNLTFNAITVDSDTSTSDTLLMISTRKASMKEIKKINDPRVKKFRQCLNELMLDLAKLVVKDGEGARKFIEITVTGTKTEKAAFTIAKSIADSPLVKTAIAGEDPNWGRVVMAIGKCGIKIKQEDIAISFGNFLVAEKGAIAQEYSESRVSNYMKKDSLRIEVLVGPLTGTATVWTCDLTHDYISINADYRS